METQRQEPSSPLAQNLRRMADEIRVRIHLAGMEAKDTWAKLEPKLHEFERKAESTKDKLAEDIDKLGDELKEQMTKLMHRLKSE